MQKRKQGSPRNQWQRSGGATKMLTTTPDVDPNRSIPVMNGVDHGAKQRVLIVDDHALVRAGFKQLIDGTEDLEVVGEAGTASQALDLVMSMPCDVVLL